MHAYCLLCFPLSLPLARGLGLGLGLPPPILKTIPPGSRYYPLDRYSLGSRLVETKPISLARARIWDSRFWSMGFGCLVWIGLMESGGGASLDIGRLLVSG